jgi:hypothetical protein
MIQRERTTERQGRTEGRNKEEIKCFRDSILRRNNGRRNEGWEGTKI